ncbi:proline-rich receptor-like protein kinase PERK9 [Syzygium oleosum]|uniref:proline-rich receptor-like protein kinase PERK9 n=1 Tax=Syzygium oleosum TaxID=219896 RepID=UPI0024BAAD94|nr:proline-rich receptor-like protein kinase PERK9 [Syzygium oleosum]
MPSASTSPPPPVNRRDTTTTTPPRPIAEASSSSSLLPPPPSSAVDIDRPPTKAPLSASPLSPARADKPESAEPPAASIERSPERTARQPNDGTPEGRTEGDREWAPFAPAIGVFRLRRRRRRLCSRLG